MAWREPCTEMVATNKNVAEAAFIPMHFNHVLQMFANGMMSHYGSNNIQVVNISCSTVDSSMRKRLGVFLLEAERVLLKHGDANVRYGWLPTTKKDAFMMMNYGIIHCTHAVPISTYGTGVHLAAAPYPYLCARHCAADEIGKRYMVLCRVTMGNMELLRRLNSTQTKPSKDAYDNGVDNIQNPRFYIVWNHNIATHIHPEFIVSFKVSHQIEDKFSGWDLRKNCFKFDRFNQLPKGLVLPESSRGKVAVSDISSSKEKPPKLSKVKDEVDECVCTCGANMSI